MKHIVASQLAALALAVGVLYISATDSRSAESSSAADQQTAQQAYQQLLSVKVFAFGGIGFAGTTSDGERAFHTVAASTNGVELFQAVLKNGTREGQLYGLCGIRKLARQSFDAHAQALASADSRVMTMSGCLASEERLSNVVARIAAGSYDLHIGIAQVR